MHEVFQLVQLPKGSKNSQNNLWLNSGIQKHTPIYEGATLTLNALQARSCF